MQFPHTSSETHLQATGVPTAPQTSSAAQMFVETVGSHSSPESTRPLPQFGVRVVVVVDVDAGMELDEVDVVGSDKIDVVVHEGTVSPVGPQ